MFSHSSVTEEYLREELVALYVALHDNISMFIIMAVGLNAFRSLALK